MKGRYAGVSMIRYGAVLRGATRLARLHAGPHMKHLRRPYGLQVDRPGALVQTDSKQVQLGNGKPVFQFAALDCFTRKRVVALAPRLTSREGAAFLEKVVASFPFPVHALQSDGGSEFLGDFGKAVSELKKATGGWSGPS